MTVLVLYEVKMESKMALVRSLITHIDSPKKNVI
jgi:hypothetical protein